MIVPDKIIRSNRRSLTISILKDGNVVVKAPLKMKEEDINRFVFSKQDWIKSKLSAVTTTLAKFEDIINYEKALIYGTKYDITLSSNCKKIMLTDGCELVFPTKIAPEKRLKHLKNWYKKFAKSILATRLELLASNYGLKFSAFKITDTKGKWGSCNTRGLICINFRVIMLPPFIIDYILTHELCHLIEMNHSRKFWINVLNFYPQTKKAKTTLKEYGFLLDLYRNL